jgi:hypothetical protein
MDFGSEMLSVDYVDISRGILATIAASAGKNGNVSKVMTVCLFIWIFT